MKSITERSTRIKLLKAGYQESDLKILFRILSDVQVLERILITPGNNNLLSK